MTDRSFHREMKDTLAIADSLLKQSDDEETKMYVQHKLKEMRQYLQEKQTKGEVALEKQTDKENESIRSLEGRIQDLVKGTAEEADHLDYMEVYQNLKAVEWSEAFNALLEDKKLKVPSILDELIRILKSTYENCRKHQEEHNKELTAEAVWAGNKPQKGNALDGLTKEQVQELQRHVRYCQDKTAQYCIQSISKKLLSGVKEGILKEKKLAKHTERMVAAYNDYITKCIQFSWVALFQTPPIHIVVSPKRECPIIKDQFVESKQVPHGKLVEWPALVQGRSLKDPGCLVKVPWQLYELGQPRPSPLPAKAPTPPPPTPEIARVEDSDDTSEGTIQLTNSMSINMPTQDVSHGEQSSTALRSTVVEAQGTVSGDVRQPIPAKEKEQQRSVPKPTGNPRETKPGKSGRGANTAQDRGGKNAPRNKGNDVHPHASESTNF